MPQEIQWIPSAKLLAETLESLAMLNSAWVMIKIESKCINFSSVCRERKTIAERCFWKDVDYKITKGSAMYDTMTAITNPTIWRAALLGHDNLMQQFYKATNPEAFSFDMSLLDPDAANKKSPQQRLHDDEDTVLDDILSPPMENGEEKQLPILPSDASSLLTQIQLGKYGLLWRIQPGRDSNTPILLEQAIYLSAETQKEINQWKGVKLFAPSLSSLLYRPVPLPGKEMDAVTIDIRAPSLLHTEWTELGLFSDSVMFSVNANEWKIASSKSRHNTGQESFVVKFQAPSQTIETHLTLSLPECLNPEVWERHEYSLQDLRKTMDILPDRIVWQLLLSYHQMISNSSTVVQADGDSQLHCTQRSSAVPKVLAHIGKLYPEMETRPNVTWDMADPHSPNGDGLSHDKSQRHFPHLPVHGISSGTFEQLRANKHIVYAWRGIYILPRAEWATGTPKKDKPNQKYHDPQEVKIPLSSNRSPAPRLLMTRVLPLSQIVQKPNNSYQPVNRVIHGKWASIPLVWLDETFLFVPCEGVASK